MTASNRDHKTLKVWIGQQESALGATQIDCEHLWAAIENLQEELKRAPPNQKPAIIAEIKALQKLAEENGC